MSDLLKEAIADAKAVRETALANAKMALEEAFTPHLKSMLSAKLAEEGDEEDENPFDDEAGEDEDEVEGEEDAEEMARYEDAEGEDAEGEEEEEVEPEDEMEGVSEEDIIEIDGVKYAPIVTEDEFEEDVDVDESEELDLEAVIKELEKEIAEADDSDDEDLSEGPDDKEEDKKVSEEVDEEELEEYSGTRAEKRKKSGNQVQAYNEKVEEDLTESDEDDEEVVKEEDTNDSVDAMQEELKEYKEAVAFLRDKLHEVNILNAKLLYTNKLFKEFVLSNNQKLKIVETFDRAQTAREIKLVYSTLAESYKDNGEKKNDVVKEFASKKSGGTAPKTKIISEEVEVADRFKKLAGILND